MAVLIAFGRVAGHQFTIYDDNEYIYENPHVATGLTGSNIAWAWRALYASNWHPVTWISHMLDVQMFGLDAGKHLLVNVALHAATSVLLLFFLVRATHRQWPSAVVAAVFALHPLHVESVAWASERKDVLSAFFFALALLFYLRYVQKHSRAAYVGTVIAFSLGLASKPMLVTFPFVLLLLDWWPFRRALRWSLILEKLPFLALAVFSSIMTMRAQTGAIGRIPLGTRISNATISYVAYLGHSFFPVNLALIYPLRRHAALAAVGAALFVLLAITAVCVASARRAPYLLVGWLFYLGTLVPVIGVIQVGLQAMADRYMYIPMIGLSIAVVWLAADFIRSAKALAAIAVLVLAVFGVLTFVQVGYWQNSETLFRHAIAAVPDNSPAHVFLATALQRKDPYASSAEAREALRIDPNDDNAHVVLALALNGMGDTATALQEARSATQRNDRNPQAWKTLGTIQMQSGDKEAAVRSLEKSLSLKQDDEAAAWLADASGRSEDAIEKFREVLRYREKEADLRNNLAALLAKSNRNEEALAEYRKALRDDPDLYDARMNLGALLSRMGNDADAAKEFAEAARIRPQSSEPHVYLALINSQSGHFREAVAEVDAAIRADRNAANQQLTNAIRIPFKETNIEDYRAFLQGKAEGR